MIHFNFNMKLNLKVTIGLPDPLLGNPIYEVLWNLLCEMGRLKLKQNKHLCDS